MALKQVSPTDEFIKGLWRDNPVFIQVLGMCPALAVSNTAINARWRHRMRITVILACADPAGLVAGRKEILSAQLTD